MDDTKRKNMNRIFILILLCMIVGCNQGQQAKNSDTETKTWFYWAVDWHPSKDQIVVGGSADTIKLFSTTDYQLIQQYPYKGTITKTKWHPTKNLLAISVQDKVSESAILDLDTDQLTPLDSVSADGARAIGWNETGDLLAVGDYEGYLSIFDYHGNFKKRIYTGQKSIIGLDWHPSKNLIAAVGESISLYDMETDSLKDIVDRTEEREILMLCVAWHPNGTFFATGDYGDFELNHPPLLQYWTRNGDKITSIAESKAEIRNIKWSPTGDILAASSEKIRLWNSNGDLVAEATNEDLLWGVDWNYDGEILVATDVHSRLIFCDEGLTKLKML